MPQSARLSAGGGCNRYLGNAQIEVTLTSVGLPLLLRQELTFAPCVNHNIAYLAALALLLGATLLNLLRISIRPKYYWLRCH